MSSRIFPIGEGQNQGDTASLTASKPSEAKLLAAARKGDHLAFGELCRRYQPRILNIAQRVTRNREDAEDAVQNSLFRAFVRLESFDGRSSFFTWLTRITINSSLMILRKRKRSAEIVTYHEAEGLRVEALRDFRDDSPDPEASLVRREEEAILREAICRLQPNLRKVVEIQQLDERSLQETARALGLSVTATKARLFRGKMALGKTLRRNRDKPHLQLFQATRSWSRID